MQRKATLRTTKTFQTKRYSNGDTRMVISAYQGGKRIWSYGRYTFEFTRVLYMYKQEKLILVDTMKSSYRLNVLKEMMRDISELPMPQFYGKTVAWWQSYYNRIHNIKKGV